MVILSPKLAFFIAGLFCNVSVTHKLLSKLGEAINTSFFLKESKGLFLIFSKFLTVSDENGLCSYKKTKINKNISEFLFLVISVNSSKFIFSF